MRREDNKLINDQLFIITIIITIIIIIIIIIITIIISKYKL